ncbi:MAG: hypothetical protein WCW13_00395 [archaeon]|jgi:hypothetical protein
MIKKLIGGRNTVKAKVKLGKRLGTGLEGTVREANLIFGKNGKTRTHQFAVKSFKWYFDSYGAWANPKKQFQIMKELSTLNRQGKLGLRIIPTIRLIKTVFGKDKLLVTKLNIVKDLTPEQHADYLRDIKRQSLIGAKNGYSILKDAFQPVLDKNGKVIAVLTDFGQVSKTKPIAINELTNRLLTK